MQIPQIYLTLCCGRTLLFVFSMEKYWCRRVAILPSLILTREGLFTEELLAAMLSSVIRKERSAHVPFFRLEIRCRVRKPFWKSPLGVWKCNLKRTAMALLDRGIFFDWSGIDKRYLEDKRRGFNWIDAKLKGKGEVALAHLESKFWGAQMYARDTTFLSPDFG